MDGTGREEAAERSLSQLPAVAVWAPGAGGSQPWAEGILLIGAMMKATRKGNLANVSIPRKSNCQKGVNSY